MHVKYFPRETLISTLEKTKSLTEAARVLGCSYVHLKKYLKVYKDDNGKLLIDAYKNQAGKGLSKNARKSMGDNTIKTMDILTGKVSITKFTYEQLRNRIIRDKVLKPKCNVCGFTEKRADGKRPLILTFKDNNIKNFNKDNLELLCYNCYFMSFKKMVVNQEYLSGVNTFNLSYDTNSNVEYGDITYLDEDPNKFKHDIDDEDDIYDIVAR